MTCQHNLEFTDDGRFLYCTICKKLDIEETRADREERPNIYYKYDTVTRIGYQRIYHANEVYKRLQCIEPNQPSLSDINNFKLKLNNDYSLENIHRKSNVKQRKHLVYMYCELNYIPMPDIPELIKKKFYNLLGALPMKKLPYYVYIFYFVCNRLGYEELQKYIARKKQNSNWNQILDTAWNILEERTLLNHY